MTPQFFLDNRPHNGLTYSDYINSTITFLNNSLQALNGEADIDKLNTIKLNLQRSSRIERTYVINPELKEQLLEISEPQLWLVLSENWCGDSAQNIPYIAAMATVNPLIDLKILERDSNLDIMDLYLTGDSRSIPKLISFDSEGNQLFTWGPRPLEAAALVKDLKSQGMSKAQFLEKLHLWYGRNRGKALEQEFRSLLKFVSTMQLEPGA